MENPLLTGLNLVASGKDDLIAPTLGDDSYDDFQAMAEALIEAKDAGLIYDIAEQRSMSRKSYRHVARLLIPGGLTPKGKAFLKEIAQLPVATDASKAPEAKAEPEILQLRPTFAGMSIDLKALWKKWNHGDGKTQGDLPSGATPCDTPVSTIDKAEGRNAKRATRARLS